MAERSGTGTLYRKDDRGKLCQILVETWQPKIYKECVRKQDEMMSIEHFENHLFISYAHLDNEPLSPEQEGWISRFHATLEALLSTRLGERARIWRDLKLGGGDVFDQEILDQIRKSALLVSVLTPRYLNSEWCPKELREFCECSRDSGGLILENKARVFKVIKTPVESQDALPSVMNDLLGYEFYTFLDDAPFELDPELDPKLKPEYHRKVAKLAWDIAQLLRRFANSDSASAPNGAAKPTVYLAECAHDQHAAREIIEAELRHHGYPVLPDRRLPGNSEAYLTTVDQLLQKCALSVHLIGSSLGAVPDGPVLRSASMLQNDAAVQRCKKDKLRRVIWLPAGARSEQREQQEFIEALHKDAEAQFGADLLTGDIEDLKAAIHAALKKIEKPEEPGQPTARDTARSIYVICVEKDRQATIPIRKYCRKQGFEAHLPAFEGDASAVRKVHQQLMANSDGILIFYGAGDEAWKRTIESDLMKLPAYRTGKPLRASYTYLAEPETSDKRDLIDIDEPNLINGLNGFAEAEMAPFIQEMQSKEEDA
jgi:hypothetical protein